MNAITLTRRPRRSRLAPRTVVVASILALALGTSAPAVVAAAAATPSTVATISPTRLVQSTGNLYWTSNTTDEFGPNSSSIYRASKSGTPGTERPLYREDASDSYFGALAYAKVGGVWYGYFHADYYTASAYLAKIKRIPLAGGAARTLVTLPQIGGTRDLVTDGVSLFWADIAGLHGMPIGGGAVRTLATATNISHIGLDATKVYYASGQVVRSTAKTGGMVATTVVTASSTITALHVRPGAPAIIYWGETSDAVRSRPVGGVTTTYQQPLAGRYATSVSFDGTRVLWSDCTTNGLSCSVRSRSTGGTVSVGAGGYGSDLQGDAAAMFWASSSGVKKYAY